MTGPVVIPIGKIYDVVSGNAYRRWQAEMEFREAWRLLGQEERDRFLQDLKASGKKELQEVILGLVAEERRLERNAQANERLYRALGRHGILRRITLAFFALFAPYFLLAPTHAQGLGVSPRAGRLWVLFYALAIALAAYVAGHRTQFGI